MDKKEGSKEEGEKPSARKIITKEESSVSSEVG